MKTTMSYLCCILFLMGMTQVSHAQIDFSDFDLSLRGAKNETNGGGTTKPPPQPDPDGGGSNKNAIVVDWPKSGKIANNETKFSWSEHFKGPYTFTITSNDVEILVSQVLTNSITVNFGDLNSVMGQTYNVTVQNMDGTKKSSPTSFRMHPMAELEADLAILSKEPRFINADPVEKALMKAFFLEDNDWNLESEKSYHINTSDPQMMKLVLNLYQKFLDRT